MSHPQATYVQHLVDLYRNGYRKATPTTNGLSFLKEDKVMIGAEIWQLLDSPQRVKATPETGYVSMHTLVSAMVEQLTNGEKPGTILGRLNLWRSAHNRLVHPEQYTQGGYRLPNDPVKRELLVSVLNGAPNKPVQPETKTKQKSVSPEKLPWVAEAESLVSELEKEFNRKIEEEKRLAYLKFLNEEQGKAYVRAHAIGQEIKRLTQ